MTRTRRPPSRGWSGRGWPAGRTAARSSAARSGRSSGSPAACRRRTPLPCRPQRGTAAARSRPGRCPAASRQGRVGQGEFRVAVSPELCPSFRRAVPVKPPADRRARLPRPWPLRLVDRRRDHFRTARRRRRRPCIVTFDRAGRGPGSRGFPRGSDSAGCRGSAVRRRTRARSRSHREPGLPANWLPDTTARASSWRSG